MLADFPEIGILNYYKDNVSDFRAGSYHIAIVKLKSF
jgi:hypothetical protein